LSLPEIAEVAMSLEPLLASSERRGRPAKWLMRRIADAVFYLLRSGCAWRMLPRE
jgi:putative transposase